jgi:hypothetical protein
MGWPIPREKLLVIGNSRDFLINASGIRCPYQIYPSKTHKNSSYQSLTHANGRL